MVFLSPKSLSLLMDPPFYDVFFASELRLERREFRPRYFSPFACLSSFFTLALLRTKTPQNSSLFSPALRSRVPAAMAVRRVYARALVQEPEAAER